MITEDAVHDLLREFEIAQASRDFDQVATMVHPDALFRFGEGDYRGLAEIRQAFEATWSHEVEDDRYAMRDVAIVHLSTEAAVASFAWEWSGVGADGAFSILGRGTAVVVVHDGRPKILVEHLSR